MRLKLVNTSAFRLSLIYALVFSLISAGGFSFIYWKSANEIRAQTDSQLRAETTNLLGLYQNGQISALTQEMNQLNTDGRSKFFLYALLNRTQRDLIKEIGPDKELKVGDSIFATLPLKSVITVPEADKSQLNSSDKAQLNQDARVLLTLLPDGYQIMVGSDLYERQALLKRILNVIISLVLVVFTLALFVGALIGYGVLRRINKVRQTAVEIVQGDLSQRMQVTDKNDEFDRLNLVVNTMLSRIEQLMQTMHQVTDNLAHDLRNPLNRLRNRLEVSLIQNLDREGYQKVQQESIQDIDDIILTFNSLLNIAQAESGKHDQDWVPIDLKPFLEELSELYSIAAEEAGIAFNCNVERSFLVLAENQLMAQTFTNLLDNAIKFTPQDGKIDINTIFTEDTATIEVSDTGPGIPEDKREEVFERFTRLDNARSTPGNGLGLSLVRAVVDRHRGKIELLDTAPVLKVILTFNAYKPNAKKTTTT
jgi:signal transduction histidine kinase